MSDYTSMSHLPISFLVIKILQQYSCYTLYFCCISLFVPYNLFWIVFSESENLIYMLLLYEDA